MTLKFSLLNYSRTFGSFWEPRLIILRTAWTSQTSLTKSSSAEEISSECSGLFSQSSKQKVSLRFSPLSIEFPGKIQDCSVSQLAIFILRTFTKEFQTLQPSVLARLMPNAHFERLKCATEMTLYTVQSLLDTGRGHEICKLQREGSVPPKWAYLYRTVHARYWKWTWHL